jgi:dolichyl-phosphate-mannose--protein O-mannosyl transferase/Gpi18-like mannosyltransferase
MDGTGRERAVSRLPQRRFAARAAVSLLWAAALVSGPATALADDIPSVSSISDKVAGIFSGVILFALLLYALYVAAKPLIESRDRGFAGAMLTLFALWIIKSVVVAFSPGFRVDVGTFEAWALDIASNGPSSMYRSGFFLDYPPGYLYALWAAGAVARMLNAADPLLRVIIETPALIADFVLAALMFAMVRRRASAAAAWLAMLFVALNPALVFDTVIWGQSDSALTLAMLLSVAMILDDEIELGWSLAALAMLIKPQALMLLPVLAVWTLRKTSFQGWLRGALAFVAVVVIGTAPFQIGHPWSWLPDLYFSTAAYYHETSVNAFNLMALIGGLRQNDAETLFGISWFALGLSMLVPLYVIVLWPLWRNPSHRNLLATSFLALFGFFLVAPRMHERYVYAAVVFAIPLALQESAMLAVFVLVTLTALFNLAYVLHTLNTIVFLTAHDGPAMVASLLNCCAFAIAAIYGLASERVLAADSSPPEEARTAIRPWFAQGLAALRSSRAFGAAPADTFARFPWTRLDSVCVALLTLIAAGLRFWHLGHPAEIVFDEVHFVGQARHYLHGEPFLDPHPPIAKLGIAAGIFLFGDHPASWRVVNALTGTALVAVTYLVGRRMFRSRLAAGLGAALVGLDGYFLVDSRIGCIDIIYVTFAAIAYWLLFRFIQTPGLRHRRFLLIPLGVILGLCLGSKLYVPVVTFMVVAGFVAFTLWRPQASSDPKDAALAVNPLRLRWVAGAMIMTGAISAIFYFASFTPHYTLGWWGGIADLFHYYKDVVWYEKSVSTATHPYASPWWSWPMMLRPVAYWQNFPEKGSVVATIWGAGNPLTWWGVIPAMTITAVRALERPNIARTFLVIGFLAYYVIWIPIGRILFLYHYMPSVYLGYLALGAVLADLYYERAEFWESFVLLMTVIIAAFVGLGHMCTVYNPTWVPKTLQLIAGLPVAGGLGLIYLLLVLTNRSTSRFVFFVFVGASFLLFLYYLPIWLGTPIARDGYYARMWFQGPGLRNWI